MAKKPEPPPAKPDGLGDTAPVKAQWNSFSGRSGIALDKIATVGKAAPTGELNVHAYAQAARARTASSMPVAGEDALSRYRRDGTWDAKSILAAFAAEPAEDSGKKKKFRRDADPEGLVSAAQTTVALAILGESKGIRALASSLARSDHLDAEQRRRIDSITRAAGGRGLSIDNLRQLVELCGAATGPKDAGVVERTAQLVGLRDSVRTIGDTARHVVSPRQLYDVRAQEACLVIVDMPVREASVAKRGPNFSRVVSLLRDVKGELMLVDPQGLFDPNKGADDSSVQTALMRKPDEMAAREYLAGVRPAPPVSPVARLLWNGYLSSTPPKTLASVEIFMVRGSTFRYC
ncbi:MAG: hypothetical protein ABIJ09_14440 [Pseudomonadota bacterium]